MKKRFQILISEVEYSEVFADVGCDHGYIAYGVLKSGKCKKAIITDVSDKCLKKAEELLNVEFNGRYESYVCDGFSANFKCDQALIAGMGGEEIVKIMSNAENLPLRLILQPMKNSDKVRRYLIDNGYEILRDYTFKDGKFYDVIVALNSGKKDCYSELEYIFGRDNLRQKSEDFKEYISAKKFMLENSVTGKDIPEEVKEKIELYGEILK